MGILLFGADDRRAAAAGAAAEPRARARARRARDGREGGPAPSSSSQARPAGRAAPARAPEGALRGDVLRLALAGLDPHRVDAELAQVVRRRAHVQLADLAGQLEAVQRSARCGTTGAELVGPLVEVHAGVQAARLLERRPGPRAVGCRVLQRPGRRREEAEGVEVRAADLVLTRRPASVPVGRRAAAASPRAGPARPVLPVDHRPLVQAEAAELRGTGRGARPAGRG